MRNSERGTKTFPPQGSLNPLGVEYGDLIEYGNRWTDTTVMMYATRYVDGNELVVDNNVCCYMSDVRRIVHKGLLQIL